MKKSLVGSLFVGFALLLSASYTSAAEEVNLPTPYIGVSNVVLPDEDGKQAIVIANEGQQFTLYWSSIDLPEGASIGVRIFNGEIVESDNISEIPNKEVVSGLSATATSYTWRVLGNDGTWGVGSDNRPNVSGLRGEKYTIVLYVNNRDGHTIAQDAGFYITITPPLTLRNFRVEGADADFAEPHFIFEVHNATIGTFYQIEVSTNLDDWRRLEPTVRHETTIGSGIFNVVGFLIPLNSLQFYRVVEVQP